MEGKSTDWVRGPSGPTVCRCCFAEGCYKDISTEYFWMGKKEVYCEMLTETFDLSIAFAQTSGPNSNSRLICEPCISRLRDASEFKKQVQECEKMFMQYLDPGRSTVEEIQLEITQEPMEKGVKLEPVKLEKNQSDDDFDDRGGFEDMDEDDLDDQPLTKLASKVPKKESVDLLDLLDNAKAEKRKSSTKAKASPAKKAKTKKETPKATVSKPKPEKKKKGRESEEPIQAKKMSDAERWRANLRDNVSSIISTTTACPFKYKKGRYLCFFCVDAFQEAEKLREHHRNQHYDETQLPKLKAYDPTKVDIADASCKLCSTQITDYAMLKTHLAEHGKQLVTTSSAQGETVLPFKMLRNSHVCQLCGKPCESLMRLLNHMHSHSTRHVCDKCGSRFRTSVQLANHLRMKECGTYKKDSVEADDADDRSAGEQRRITLINNLSIIITMTTVQPFRFDKGVYLCYYCKETFTEPAVLRQHNREQHTEVKKIPKYYEPAKADFVDASCKICLKEVPDNQTLKAHLAEHGKELDMTYGESVIPYNLNSSSEHVCQICGKKYETFVGLHRHMNEHYDSYICDQCGKKFITSRQMIRHASIHDTQEQGLFPCKNCDQTFTIRSHLASHITKEHKPRERNKCPICNEKFAFYGQRLKHLRTVHDQKTADYPCPSCDKVFDLSSKRSEHIRAQHLQMKRHECQVCGMKFFSKTGLDAHSVKHGGERKFQCEVCSKAYARLKTLREHMRIHNNDRRFTCSACGQAFVQKCSMKHHIKVHHPTLLKDEIES
ncbi:zinc finger protein 16-like isoform X5 [Leguminivora glycinivorella]|uniref:zinc finger protein 16-like isoform X5 n=1 Tax=Leguminivora glycinivorella TaxID=1035111 RepID=UPI00200E59E2|nr:zinc finger protein 16-like isoform X5 [Leguminivora glycinivorella]